MLPMITSVSRYSNSNWRLKNRKRKQWEFAYSVSLSIKQSVYVSLHRLVCRLHIEVFEDFAVLEHFSNNTNGHGQKHKAVHTQVILWDKCENQPMMNIHISYCKTTDRGVRVEYLTLPLLQTIRPIKAGLRWMWQISSSAQIELYWIAPICLLSLPPLHAIKCR